MAPKKRVSAEARRQQILDAALDVFANHGLHGTTTRAIADAAGVSEALLYRHFASKEALYEAIQSGCLAASLGVAGTLAGQPKGTRTLVAAVHFMAEQIIDGRLDPEHHLSVKRLILGSLAGDGGFVRGFTKANMAVFIEDLVELLRAAAEAGDVDGEVDLASARFWFSHHLFAMIGAMRLHEPPIVAYGVGKRRVVEEAVRFALRGLGLRAAAIQAHYQPRELERFLRGLAAEAKVHKSTKETPDV